LHTSDTSIASMNTDVYTQTLTLASYAMAVEYSTTAFSTVIPCFIICSHLLFNCVSQ